VAGSAGRVFEDFSESHLRTFYYDHVMWFVRERPAPSWDIKRTSHLVFECDICIRRVRNFPMNWRDLGARELYELSWRT
jgi:hypothetical protein